jgi:hypothetical protein
MPVRLVAVVLLVAALVVSATAYRAVCVGSASAYEVMAEARSRASSEAAVGARGAGLLGTATTSIARARAAALGALLEVKQSDAVAFPAHAVVGLAVEAGPCTPEARAAQWRKAAKHASTPPAAELAAAGLRRTLGPNAALAAMRADAVAEPWFAPSLDRVAAALDDGAPSE